MLSSLYFLPKSFLTYPERATEKLLPRLKSVLFLLMRFSVPFSSYFKSFLIHNVLHVLLRLSFFHNIHLLIFCCTSMLPCFFVAFLSFVVSFNTTASMAFEDTLAFLTIIIFQLTIQKPNQLCVLLTFLAIPLLDMFTKSSTSFVPLL